MEKDDDVTKVIFRKWPNGDIIALFPEVIEDAYNNCLSYEHFGQHGAATYTHVVNITELATPEEYADLYAELESIGYNLKPIKRFTRPYYVR